MSLTLIEQPGRKSTFNVSTGILQHASMRFVLYSDLNDALVRAYVRQNLPTKYENVLGLDNFDLDERTDDPGTWDILASYVLPEEQQQNTEFNPVKLQFSTGGVTKTLKYSKETVASGKCPQGNPDKPRDFANAVNVGEDDIEGVEYPVPALDFGFTYKVLPQFINLPLIKFMTGKVNANPYRGFDPGELMFMGCDGAVELTIGGELTYKFSSRENKTAQRINKSRLFAVRGWDYVWCTVEKKEDPAAKKVLNRPTAFYVERMADYEDFNLLGIL